MPRLSPVVGAILLSVAHVSGTALPMTSSSCREDDGPTKYPRIALPLPTPGQKNEEFVLGEVWTRHLKWDKLAKQTKNKVRRGRVSALVLLFSGGILQTFAHNSAGTPLTSLGYWIQTHDAIFKVGGSAAVGAAHLINKNYANKDNMQDWTNAMAIAEKIKGQVYRFQAAIPPYEKKDFEAVRRLVTEVTQMSEADMDLTLKYARTDLTKKEHISHPPKLDRKLYLERRYQPQLNKYLRDAEKISKKIVWLDAFRGILLVASTSIGPLSCVTGLGKSYAKFVTFLGPWSSPMTSGAMAIASHYHACKYHEVAEQWSHAAMQLQNLRLTLPNDAEPDFPGEQEIQWRVFVERCEQYIYDATIDWTLLKNRPDEPKGG